MRLGHRSLGAASLLLNANSAYPEGTIEVTHVSTKPWHAGKRLATKLLQQVCKEADAARRVLVLMPDTDRLASWYAGQGFHVIQETPKIMARPIGG